MSINTLRPEELIAQRKSTLSIRDNTDNLTHSNDNNDTRAAAYKSNRDNADELAIIKLSHSTVEDELLADLELMEKLEERHINSD